MPEKQRQKPLPVQEEDEGIVQKSDSSDIDDILEDIDQVIEEAEQESRRSRKGGQ